MGFADIIRGAVATAKSVVGGDGGVMDDVTIQYWIGELNDAGDSAYSSPVKFEAIVERVQKVVKALGGQEVIAAAHIVFLEELPPNGANERREPLDERDIITLSDGTTGPIITMTGLMDSETNSPYLMEVYLG